MTRGGGPVAAVEVAYESGQFEWRSHPLRLTAAGHEFAAALNRDDVWSVLKTEFKDASLETLYRVSRSLVEAYARKQLGKYLDL